MRTTLDYIQGGKLDSAASATATSSVEPVTQIPIATGSNSGDFIELTDAQAAQASTQGLNVFLLTAGSGQTNGTYTAVASYGGAVLTYTVAGNVVTAISVASDNGNYTPVVQAANANTPPTFTLAANGGTAGTVQASFATLRAGVYQKVKLTSTVTSVTVGQALFWNPTDLTDPYAVTNVSGAAQADFAGVVIDPAMGTNPSNSSQLSYAWIQVTGRATVLTAAAIAVGGTVALPTTTTNQFVGGVATNPTYAGTVLVASTATGSPAVARLVIPQSRY